MNRPSFSGLVKDLFARRGHAAPPRRRQRELLGGSRIEQLEERRVMAFDLVSAYATTSDDPFYVFEQSTSTITQAPQQITLRFSSGAKIDASTLGNISLVRSGGAADGFGSAGTKADVSIVPGSITVNDLPNDNEVVVRFADVLPDDTYRITIGAGLKTTANDSATPRSIDFRLDLGGFVMSVVPQPVVRAGSALSQSRNTINVHFNANDPLNVASAQTAASYRLFEVNPTTGADVAPAAPVNPTGVSYDSATGRAVLTFANGAIADGKLYRLQIGGGVVAAAANAAEGSDNNSSFTTARNLGTIGKDGLTVTGTIAPRATLPTPAGTLGFPTPNGAIDSPGHRDVPVDSGGHGDSSVSLEPNTRVAIQYYNFKADYGSVNGAPQQNAITETQKQRAREIFELFSRYSGIRFVESANQGMTVATGDIRAAAPTLPPGAVAGVGGGDIAIMNSSLDWGQSEYGGSWFRVAMHEIGHAIDLEHSYDIPSVMGKGLAGEQIFPGDYDIEQLRQLFPANGPDVDVYEFTLADAGRLSAETIVARPGQPLYNSSKLDSLLTLYREVGGKREMIARNDDSFGRDSFIGLDLAAGTYFLAVSSTGNDAFNPEVSDSGYGGRSDGDYRLNLAFQPASVAANTIVDASGTPFDGDRDGKPGGVFSFWFNTASTTDTVFVDKTAANGGNGSIATPYNTIKAAIENIGSKKIIRIVGNAANTPYLIGTTLAGQPLADGATLNVPKGVTVMIDAGAVFKLRAANIDVGSSSALVDRSGASIQVLGTPASGGSVTFTSYHDDSIGGNSDGSGPAVSGGQWGGIVIRRDSDSASKKAFVNSIAGATINFGGGQVFVDSQLDSFAPIQLETTRPTLAFNTIRSSAGAAISASPDSFEESDGRVGPELRGNRLLNNSINGLFIKVQSPLGTQTDKLDVPARLRSTDIVYVLQDNLLIDGGVGGYLNVGGVDTARRSGRLTIDPGVVVKLQGARIELERGTAQLIAEGTAGQSVVFTSLGDNRFGAGGTFDTNGNLPDVRNPGDWGGIFVNAGGRASIDHAYLGFGGGQTPIEGEFANFNVIEVHQGELRLARSRVENNANGVATGSRNGRGTNAAATIFARGAQPVILGNDFRDNLGTLVSINANSLTDALLPDPGRSNGPIGRDARFDDNRGPLVRDNRISYTINPAAGRPTGGATGGMEVRGEEITVESVWDDVDIVHVLKSEIVVQNLHTYTGVRLMSQVNAGLVVKLLGTNAGFTAAGYGLDIDDRIGGTVQVVGQPGYPVVLTSLADDTVGASLDPLGRQVKDTGNDESGKAPTPGDWRSLRFLPMSNDRNVAIMKEAERAVTQGVDLNSTPSAAQGLGVLAPNFATGANTFDSAQEKSGDEIRRLGFEVHGFISSDDPTDVDVYSFTGFAGSEVWIDIDKTSQGLDTMVELLDAAGNVRARSVDSQLEGGIVGGTVGTLSGATKGIAQPLVRRALDAGDHYSVNPKDAGMRVVLPGDGRPNGTPIQYFVRVRSQPRYEPAATSGDNGAVTATDAVAYEAGLTADPLRVKSGATSGAYELRVRLRQLDEKPGSTVRYADIRYPTIGLDVQGLPLNSPLVGETGENAGGTNETLATAQYVGNLLQTDRNAISIAGNVAGDGDVDWYTFALNYEQIQSIGGVNGGAKTWATVFDLDYGDGIRGDLTIAVYDSAGRLLYIGRDSNVASDRPGAGQGSDSDDLSRGSVGSRDPFIGPVHMPAGNPTGSGGIEDTGEATPPDPSKQTRYYVAVFGGGQLPAPLSAVFDGGTANALVRLEPVNSVTRVVEDHIGSTGYKSGNNAVTPSSPTPLFDLTNLATHVTPFTLSDVTLFVSRSGSLVTVDAMRGGIETNVSGGDVGDIFMRPDGKLYSYRGLAGAANTAGALSLVDPGNGSLTVVGNDAIPNTPDSTKQTDNNVVGTGILTSTTFTLSKAGVNAAGVTGQMTYSGFLNGNPVSGVWTISSNGLGALAFTQVSHPGGGFAEPVSGTVNGLTNPSTITVIWNQSIDSTKALLTNVNYTFTGAPNSLTTDSVDALAWSWSTSSAGELHYSVREGARSRLYRADTVSGSAAAADSFKGVIQDANSSLGIVTGMAYVGGQLYGVDSKGYFFRINPGSGAATLIDMDPTTPLVADPLRDDFGSPVGFAGLALGPRNLYSGSLANTLFAIDTSGTLRAFGTNGVLQQLFDSDNDGQADAKSIPTGASGATGLAFSPLDINLWHPTTRRGGDPGHGINQTLGVGDNTRSTGAGGGQSMYFGFEGGNSGQYGASSVWQTALSSNPSIPNTYNLPGGAYGSLTTNSFSLAGRTYADKPTLYFNYFLQSDPDATANDNARVFISKDGGATWQLLATNNPTKSSAGSADSELPTFPTTSSDRTTNSNQHVQRLHRDGMWRQARVDLGKWAGEADLRLRIDFSTAGQFDASQRNAAGDLVNAITGVANTSGGFTSSQRGQRNNYEGFYVDDFLVGFAERGEMVTGAATGEPAFVALPTAPPSPTVPAQNLQGQYQLEIRRGTEYGFQPSRLDSDVVISRTFDTDHDLTRANSLGGRRGDENHPRQQGQFIIESNLVSNAKTYGISIDAGRDGGTNASTPGVVLNTAAPNSARLVPGVVVTNNVLAGSGTAGILFSGDATKGAVPTAAVPFGRIVNNTIVGTANAGTVGIVVNDNAGPTLLNNLFASLAKGVDVDAGSQPNTVVGTSAYWSTTTPVSGVTESQPITLDADPFVNAAAGNYYLRAGSKAIDSGINSLDDRPAFVSVKQTLGIPDSRIVGPDRDLFGQLRGDDPNQASAPGLGSNVFKDRGAVDRVDFAQPSAALAVPLDNSTADQKPAADIVQLVKGPARGVTRFEIQLNDSGVGIDRTTVVSTAFELRRSGTLLVAGVDYLFNYQENSNRVVFESPSVFSLGTYEIAVVRTGGANVITDLAGNPLLGNQANGTAKFTIELVDVPGVPLNVVGTPGDARASVSWTAPANAGTSAITDYLVQSSADGGTNWITFPDGTSATNSAVVTGLTNGTAYIFRVAAVNAAGTGDWSLPSASATPLALPPATPAAPIATAGDGQASLTLMAPFDSGSPITDYEIQFSSDGGANWTTSPDGTSAAASATVTGLTNGTAYVFRVAARNANGLGAFSPASSPAVTPLAPASAPTLTGAVAGDASVSLAWTTPASNGGAAITGYVVEHTSTLGTVGVPLGVVNATTITGLVNGTAYTFRVRAVTTRDGILSDPSPVLTPLALPDAPTDVVALASSQAAFVVWTAPSDTGGVAVTGYVVRYTGGGGSQTVSVGTDSPTRIEGLVNGTSYTFAVAAVTAAGTGPFSTASGPVTPGPQPLAPSRLAGKVGDGSVSLRWTAPRTRGVSDYVIQYSGDGGATWEVFSDAVSAATRATVTGLDNGTTYVFRVAAIANGVIGNVSNVSARLTPFDRAARPAAPTNVRGVFGGNGIYSVQWDAVAGNGGGEVRDYVIQYRVNSGANARWVTFRDQVSASTSATLRRLTSRSGYVFRVAAKNVAGIGAYSAEIVVPAGVI